MWDYLREKEARENSQRAERSRKVVHTVQKKKTGPTKLHAHDFGAGFGHFCGMPMLPLQLGLEKWKVVAWGCHYCRKLSASMNGAADMHKSTDLDRCAPLGTCS